MSAPVPAPSSAESNAFKPSEQPGFAARRIGGVGPGGQPRRSGELGHVPATSVRTDTSDEARSVLSTLNDDGSRRWISPKLSQGRFLTRRRIVAYVLIAIFVALPLVQINGKPLILLDIISRRFHIFGGTFLPTDTLLLALLLVGVGLTVFWLTALFGRVWCGWACPQTVYMEFLYRPIERLFQGSPGRAPKGWLQTSGFGKVLKYPVYLACSLALAHTFLAYFVSWDQLGKWVFGSPLDHPVGFGVVMLVTAAMMFDFSYFREQVCIVACPYGRMQSVLLDRHSLIVRYDQRRGEPRGRKGKPAKSGSPAGDVALPVLAVESRTADCVDCGLCVTTCPTGIDIRNGLQMECVNCTQCIDACDAVMTKLGRPRGLIRYSSHAAMEGQKLSLLRPRVVLYPALIAAVFGLFTLVLVNTGIADVSVMRGLGQPFTIVDDARVLNTVRVKIVNRIDAPAEFAIGLRGIEGARIVPQSSPVRIEAGQMVTVPAQVFVPRSAFVSGKAIATITVDGPQAFAYAGPITLIGPYGPSPALPAVQPSSEARP